MTQDSKTEDSMTTSKPSGDGRSRFLLLSLLVLVLDQWSKHWVETSLALHTGRIEVIPGFLDLIHVRNTGVAFGLFASHGDQFGTWLLTGLGILALGFVGYYFYVLPREDRAQLIALALVLGGAVGNLFDRAVSGGVTDFIDAYVGSYHWHTFNVADSAITVGICLMLLASFRSAPQEDAPDPTEATTEAATE